MSEHHPMPSLAVTASTLVTALGVGKQANWQAILAERSGLTPVDRPDLYATWWGRVAGLETAALPDDWADFDCRNHRLARLTLETDAFAERVRQASERHGAARIGLFVGTSTSGIAETEQAYADAAPELTALRDDFDLCKVHNIGALATFVQRWLGLSGPALSISTACSSSAKVFASAARAIAAGLCDAAVVGGVDSLCLTTLYGFHSLNLVSPEPCRPWDQDRQGISIGEAAGFVLLELAETAAAETIEARLLGYGESADAHHMSTPHPEGLGARSAMEQALTRASLAPGDIDYVNLHGTGTPSNDAAEDAALAAVFGPDVACSSTKGWTGHTLGAAGIVEAILAMLVLQHQQVPGTLNLQTPDPALATPVQRETAPQTVHHVMSNSFGFGGSNCALVFGR